MSLPPDSAPSSLSVAVLARRLRELAGDERNLQVDFLLHLAEFDGRRAYADAGFESLWMFCLRELHLREGAAARRITAMRALRRFPALEAPLRDGRLCMSTVRLLAPVLSEENVSEVAARAAHQTQTEVERLVAALQPRATARDGIRRIPQPAHAGPSSSPGDYTQGAFGTSLEGVASIPRLAIEPSQSADVTHLGKPVDVPGRPSAGCAALLPADSPGDVLGAPGIDGAAARAIDGVATPALGLLAAPAMDSSRRPTHLGLHGGEEADTHPSWLAPGSPGGAQCPRSAPSESAPTEVGVARGEARVVELRPVSADRWSMRVTLDDALKAELDTLASLLSHKAGSDLAAVLREAIRCGIEKHGKRRGAVAPHRARRPTVEKRASPSDAVAPCVAPPRVEKAAPKPEQDSPPSRGACAPAATTNAAIGPGAGATATESDGSPSISASSSACSSASSSTSSNRSPPANSSTSPGIGSHSTGGETATETARATTRRAIPAEVRRTVWARDGGTCCWTTKDGRRCGSRWKLEIDHIVPEALGGEPEVANLRLLCRGHNLLHAERVFGRHHMSQFRRLGQDSGTGDGRRGGTRQRRHHFIRGPTHGDLLGEARR